MKKIAVCVKETNDGYSSDFLYKSNDFVTEGVVTDIRLSWISGVFDSSTNELREKLKETTPLKFIKFTKEYFYLVILKMGQTSRWNDNVAVWCQIPVGVNPTYTEWNNLISNIEGVLSKKEALTKPESWSFLDAITSKTYDCADIVVDYTESSKTYACRYLTISNNIYDFLKNYYQAGYQKYEAVVLFSEDQKQTVTCKPSVKDLTSEQLNAMVVLQVPQNPDGWQPYNERNELFDKPMLVGVNEEISVYWKKIGCKTICKNGVGGTPSSFLISQTEYRKLMNKSSFHIRDEKGQDVSQFSVKIDGKDFRNGELELPMDFNLTKADVAISLKGVEKTDGKSSQKIIFGVVGVVVGLAIGLIVGFSRTPKVVEVPVQQARPFSCARYFEENKNVWEKASMDSCSDLKGAFELLASYDFKALQEKSDLFAKYDGLKDLIPMIAKSVELGFQVDAENHFKSGSINVAEFKDQLLTMYMNSYESWFKEELDIFAPDLFDALYAYDKETVKKYSKPGRDAIKNICDNCLKAGKVHPQHYLNAEEINIDDYVKSFSNAPAVSSSSTKKQETPSKPVKDYSGQGADD